MTEDELKNYLIEKYDPLAIVLSGSRVSGNICSDSDWDVYVFTDIPHDINFESFKGEILDIAVEKSMTLQEGYIFDTRFHPERDLKVLLDTPEGLANKAVENTNKKYEQGPEKVSEIEKKVTKKVLIRHIQKAESRKNIEGLPFYHIGIFYSTVLRLWFQVRGEWPLAPYEALPEIKNRDPEVFSLLEDISLNKSLEIQIESANKIVEKLAL